MAIGDGNLTSTPERKPYIVIGGGPSGLAAAYELAQNRYPVRLFEKSPLLGGIARTENFRGYSFDMGGHRFFTKSAEIDLLWKDLLGDDFLVRPRMSRIYYKKKFFHYPLKPFNALFSLGVLESFRVAFSYLRWAVFPYRSEETFDRWATNRFGKRLFKIFLESYTEKVWGIACSEIQAGWAAQRIMNLSLRAAIVNMFIKAGSRIKTLIEEFHYPRKGPGMLWEALRRRIVSLGGELELNAHVERIHHEDGRIHGVTLSRNQKKEKLTTAGVISSMPLPEFVHCLRPAAPAAVLAAADQLRYHDFLTVCLIVDRADTFPDNWIYIHEPDVQVGRIQNFKNWSPDMVANSRKSSLGLEYFCNRGDPLWNMADEALIEMAKNELEKIGLADPETVEDGTVYRVANAYPVYDGDYGHAMETVKQYVGTLENVQTIGRSGLHRYDNQDHAMLTGIFAGRNIIEEAGFDLWAINTDDEYHEQLELMAEPSEKQFRKHVEKAISLVFHKIDALSFGAAAGGVTGIFLALATLYLSLHGGAYRGPSLHLLSQFFPGYTVSLPGSLYGFFYGFVTGFMGGWIGALLRNTMAVFYFTRQYRSAERRTLQSIMDFLT